MRIKGSAVHDFNDFVTCSGSPVKEVFSPKVLDNGQIELVKSSEFSLQDYIESFRDQTDMSFIVQQLKAGNPAVLNVQSGMYGDFTQMPKTYAEVLQLNINAKKAFAALPLDVKKAYEMDFNKWFADVGSKEWLELMSPKNSDFLSESSGDFVVEKEVNE